MVYIFCFFMMRFVGAVEEIVVGGAADAYVMIALEHQQLTTTVATVLAAVHRGTPIEIIIS